MHSKSFDRLINSITASQNNNKNSKKFKVKSVLTSDAVEDTITTVMETVFFASWMKRQLKILKICGKAANLQLNPNYCEKWLNRTELKFKKSNANFIKYKIKMEFIACKNMFKEKNCKFDPGRIWHKMKTNGRKWRQKKPSERCFKWIENHLNIITS